MIIGVPKEIKSQEYRVGMVPNSVTELVQLGHSVLVEKNAGAGIGMHDNDYKAAGAVVVDTAAEIFARADIIVKVKEPQPQECALLREGQILFAYLHLAPDPAQARLLKKSGCIAIAYETVTNSLGRLPLLSPMSEVAGRLSIQVGASFLEKFHGGSGILLSGVPGVAAGNVVVLGGGVVGTNAIRMALGQEAHVTVLDKSIERLQELRMQFGAHLNFATIDNLEHYISNADLVIGAVLVPGDATPKLVRRQMLSKMRPGSVIVDVAIDQGGCFETSHPTTHADPTFTVDGIVHYCVTNMPGAVPRTATLALNNATLPFIVALASKGYRKALLEDPHLMNGLNVYAGHYTHEAVAHALGEKYTAASSLLN
jgi:alanine dehydrogenase